MKRLRSLPLFAAVLLACAANAPAQEQQQQANPPATVDASAPATLTNKDVLDMLRAGLSAEIVAAKIRNSDTKFDTSPAALQELKTAGAPDAVVLAMVEKPVRTTAVSADAGSSAPLGPVAADPTKATVYVFRHKNFGTRNMQPSVYVDGVEVARSDDGKYFAVRLEPGKHTVEVNKGHSGAQIDMKAGEEYYFRVDLIPGFWKARSKIDFIQKEQGALEIKKMKPLEAKWIKDKTRVVVGDATATASAKD